MTRRAVLYSRISRDRVGAGLGVERQEADCRQLAERLGWQVVATHTDNDISAYGGKRRPGYEALLDDLQSGRADAVIAWHTDRLHRRPIELEGFIDLCEQRSISVQTVRAGEIDLSTPTGQAIARTVGAWARHEVAHSIARQKRAKAQAAEAGRYRGGRRPYGYESDGVTVREGEAKIVREITGRVLVGEALNAITRDLNVRGLTTSTGRPWKYTEVRRLILRARNAGIVEHEGQEVADAEWSPIVDRDTWRAARAVLTDPGRKPPRSHSGARFLGSGLFICGVCGDTMLSATTQGAGRRRRPAYRCRGGSHLTRMAEPVDAFVSGVAVERLSRPDARLLLRPERAADVTALQGRSNTLRGRLDELGTLYAAGDIDGRQLSTATASIRAQLEHVESELTAMAAGSPLAGFADAADVGAAWTAANVSRRKAVIRTLMTVTLLKAPRGRRPGGGYFDPEFVKIEWMGDAA